MIQINLFIQQMQIQTYRKQTWLLKGKCGGGKN